MSVKDITERLAQPESYVDNNFLIPSGGSAFSVTLGPGFRTSFVMGYHNVELVNHELYNIAIQMRVDVDDEDHDWPNGSALSGPQISSLFFPTGLWWNDLLDEAPGMPFPNIRWYSFLITNTDGSSHTYYTRFKIYHLRVPQRQVI